MSEYKLTDIDVARINELRENEVNIMNITDRLMEPMYTYLIDRFKHSANVSRELVKGKVHSYLVHFAISKSFKNSMDWDLANAIAHVLVVKTMLKIANELRPQISEEVRKTLKQVLDNPNDSNEAFKFSLDKDTDIDYNKGIEENTND